MEVLVGARKHGQEAKTAAVMSAFEIIDVSREIAERSVLLRVKHGMKLPDAIILATAQSKNCQLISRNTKDFAGIAGVISPYQL
ncbi:toxin-antitoxin system, toxin component, PIN family [Yokenella regensburgei ATCC 43003]|nr:toxin-antitoxin system, toxin component, PIN family [Yokenella regensburgei ATCC 43003]